VADDDRPPVEIDVLHVADLDVDVAEQAPERDDDVRGLDRPGDDVGQQGLEDEVVLAVDERDRDVAVRPEALRPPEQLRELLGGRHPGEATAEDDDPFGHDPDPSSAEPGAAGIHIRARRSADGDTDRAPAGPGVAPGRRHCAPTAGAAGASCHRPVGRP
jgi:hypothetical protein